MREDGGRPLSGAIQRLLQAEREAPPPSPEVAVRVLRRLGKTLAAPLSAPAGSLLGSAKSYLVAVTLAAGLAAVGAQMARPSADQPPATPAATPPATTDPATSPSRPATIGTSAPTGTPALAPISPRAVPAPVHRNDDALMEQSAQLLSARRALAGGNIERARKILRQHARRWPRSALEQEREILLIDTVAASGDQTDALRRAERFLRRYPDSTHAATAKQHLRDGAASLLR
jgi:TolA-binding protein